MSALLLLLRQLWRCLATGAAVLLLLLMVLLMLLLCTWHLLHLLCF
jgi:hypothetical protein